MSKSRTGTICSKAARWLRPPRSTAGSCSLARKPAAARCKPPRSSTSAPAISAGRCSPRLGKAPSSDRSAGPPIASRLDPQPVQPPLDLGEPPAQERHHLAPEPGSEVHRVAIGGIVPDRESPLADVTGQRGPAEREQRTNQASHGGRHPGEPGGSRAADDPHEHGLDLIVGLVPGEDAGRVLPGRQPEQRGITRLARGGLAGTGPERFPKEGVIPVSAAIVADRAADRVRHRAEVFDDLFERLRLQRGVAGDGLVQIVHVSLVVTPVMDLHCRGVNVRFERRFIVRK